ncbi:FtsW/RodA/SpoVE family cell cycle protein [Paenibacillus sp. 1001270B_150601_E10]|uniref:FtsW/RodA/SpoVE family cell cycle protein n=1 Tax=Paenibacillus sp. 1001270B_150601_E10 TaxID=2787079 RepID=UPI00189F63FD|nr:FtsW/RodA/SpoVE family cell cycle protein [Paenibacillus sp. 1001270B_150601_E10]
MEHRIRDQYLDQVCKQIKAKDMHDEIRDELLSHWDELVQDALEDGCPDENVDALVHRQMGDPEEVGRGFNQVHCPKMNWGLIVSVGILVVIGIVISIFSSLSLDHINLIVPKLVYSALGIAIMFAFIFMDYRIFKKYSWVWFVLPFIIHMIVYPWTIIINGARNYLPIGPFSINVFSCYTVLFLIGISGIIQRTSTSVWKYRMKLLTISMLPFLLFIISNERALYLMYAVALFAILWGCLRSKWYFYIVSGLHVLFGLIFLFLSPNHYVISRILGFFSNDEDYHFIVERSREAIMSGGWWGRGLQAASQSYPYIYSDYALSYLFDSLGWIIGALCLTLIAYVIVQFACMSKQVKDSYGKTIMIAFAALIGFQYIYNILMVFGFVPQSGISSPIISYGGTYSILTLAIIGMMLSIYRRKDMLPRQSSIKE